MMKKRYFAIPILAVALHFLLSKGFIRRIKVILTAFINNSETASHYIHHKK